MDNQNLKSWILHLLFMAGVVGFLLGINLDIHWLRMVSKPLPVVSLLFMIQPDTSYKKRIFLGFVFSLMGDILLESSAGLFVFGLLSFLVAHLFYISAFVKRKTSNAILPAIVLLLFAGGYYYFLYPGLGEMSIPVLIYIVVITIMVWSAFAQRTYNEFAKFASWGALFFLFSDSLIAYTKFHASIDYSRYLIILTYWLAQYLIYYSTKNESIKNREI